MSIYPTLCELASVPLPDQVQGKSIRSLLQDPKSNWTGVALTTHGKNNHAVRDQRWRYIQYSDGSEELYDHDADMYEWTNLASNPEFTAIRQELSKHFPTINADPPNGNNTGATKLQKPKKQDNL